MTATVAPLARGRVAYLPALRAAVDRLDPRSRAVAAYHLGWADRDGHPLEGDGGKGVRPSLALLSAEAVRGSAELALPGAVAVQLVHDFSLLHDDVMDGDRERRHRPTAWTVFGVGAAILAGDALLALAQQVLQEAPANAPAASRLLFDAVAELIRGQFADVSFEHRDDVELDEVLDMAAAKTGALLAASSAIGAVLVGAQAPQVAALLDYGRCIGLAFQLVDDLLGIWGEPEVTGKPVLSDLRARKKTLPVTFAARSDTAAGGELLRWLSRGDGADDEVTLRRVARLVVTAGGRDWATAEATRQVELAESALAAADLAPGAAQELGALGRSLLTRRA